MRYHVVITRYETYSVDVEAADKESAEDIAMDLYNDGEVELGAVWEETTFEEDD